MVSLKNLLRKQNVQHGEQLAQVQIMLMTTKCVFDPSPIFQNAPALNQLG